MSTCTESSPLSSGNLKTKNKNIFKSTKITHISELTAKCSVNNSSTIPAAAKVTTPVSKFLKSLLEQVLCITFSHIKGTSVGVNSSTSNVSA